MRTKSGTSFPIPSNYVHRFRAGYLSGCLLVHCCLQDQKFLAKIRDKTGENQRQDYAAAHKHIWIVPDFKFLCCIRAYVFGNKQKESIEHN